jgi:hypothetical protein
VYEGLSVGAAAPSDLSMAISKVSTTRFVVMESVLSWREAAGVEFFHGRPFIRWSQPGSVDNCPTNGMPVDHRSPPVGLRLSNSHDLKARQNIQDRLDSTNDDLCP